MIRGILEKQPDAEFTSANVGHIAHAGQVVHVSMRTPGHLAMGNAYYFDGTGKLLGDGGLETGTIGQQILGALQPLHFGWFGGFLVKVVYGLLGIAITIVTHSGITIWLARRREQGRPAPHWEKVWTALAWSQPLALALVGLVIFAGAEAYAIAAYLGITVASILASQSANEAITVSRVLRVLSGFAIVAMVILHGLNLHDRMNDPMAMWASGTFIAIALLLAGSAMRPSQVRKNAA
jgi:uncharacterized iron-regulated membrane protein